jgi:hypothetical protein
VYSDFGVEGEEKKQIAADAYRAAGGKRYKNKKRGIQKPLS